MARKAIKCVVITPEKEVSFRKKLDRLKERIRQRAFELYSRRGRPGSEKSDWLQAEHEMMLCPLAGIEGDGRAIRITAAVPNADANDLTVDVLPGELVVEAQPPAGRSMERCSEFPLHDAINPAAVTAELQDGQLTIVAPKAARATGVGQMTQKR